MGKKEYVKYLLENYNKVSSDIKQLQFELESFENLLQEEVIDTMSFSSSFAKKVHSCPFIDKTSTTAIIYEEVSQRMNREARDEIIKAIKTLEYEIKKLNYCIDRLEPKIKEVIKGIYLDKKSWEDLRCQLFISHNCLNRYRRKGIEELTKMYNIGI